MDKVSYLSLGILVGFMLLVTSCEQATRKTSPVPNDTIKADNEYIPMPSGVDLQTRSFYIKTSVYDQGYAKITRVDILHEWPEIKNHKNVLVGQVGKKYKILYSFTGKDTLAFDAIFSAVKYDSEYYVVVFPHHREWMDFTPPEGKDGYFLYTPIAFHLDTVKWVLTKLKYNQNLKINYKKSMNAPYYTLYSRPHQFDRPFAFSKKRNQFAFGKVMKKLIKN